MSHRLLKHFFSHQSGSILMLFGLSFLFLVGIAGAGYDLGRQQLVRQKLQQASDAAALAGAGMILGSTPAQRTAEAMRYFQLNYPATYLGVSRPSPLITVNANDIRVDASANVVTNFVTNLGVNTMVSAGRSSAQFKKGYNKVDLIMVMDNSGSMRTQDIGISPTLPANMAAATTACQAEFYSPGQSAYILANYPSAASPNPLYLTAYRAWCNSPNVRSYGSFGRDVTGIVGPTRMNALRYTADFVASTFLNPNPNDHQIATVLWDNTVIASRGFSNDYTTVRADLMRMYAAIDTDSSVGMARAQTIGSTGFRSGAIHAVILMTDGGNCFGACTPYPDPVTNAATLAICNSFKASGTLVYTIGFGGEVANASASSGTIRQFLSDCATGPNGPSKPNLNTYYYVAPDGAALQAAFVAIAGNLQDLRILN